MNEVRRPVDPMSKHWVFTHNNYTEADYHFITHTPCEYVVVGKEVGERGTPHLQGYICFVNRKRLTGVKKILPGAHWEIKRGTPLEASTYCKKDGNFYESGVLPASPHEAGGQATQEKWASAFELAKTNQLEEIQPKMLIQYYSTFKRIAQDYQHVPDDLADVCGEWFYGEPRTGKSRSARALYPGFYDKPCNKWWDGYKNHPYVIIDDFDKNHEVLGHHLKRWADRYSFPAEHKGHTYQIRPKKIIVTSNYHPKDIFNDAVLLDAIMQRFRFTHFTHNSFNPYCGATEKPKLQRTQDRLMPEIDEEVLERLRKEFQSPQTISIDDDTDEDDEIDIIVDK